jgi:hypothetical protein
MHIFMLLFDNLAHLIRALGKIIECSSEVLILEGVLRYFLF